MSETKSVPSVSIQPVKLGASAMWGDAYTAGSYSHPDMRRWTPVPGSADADLLPSLNTIRSRSRDLDRNHGVAAGALQTHSDNIVGQGLRLKSRPDWKALGWTDDRAEAWSNKVESLWCGYADTTECDAANSLNFAGLTTQILRSGFQNGEGLSIPLWIERPGSRYGTKMLNIEPDRLTNPYMTQDTARLRGGIEIDQYGAPVAYWIRKIHPGDRYWMIAEFSFESDRIPAYTAWGRRRVIHVHDRERVGQSRGKPALAAVLRQFKVLGDYTNAELKSAVVNAMVALVTESAVGQEGLVELLTSNPEALKAYQDGLQNRNRSAIDFGAGMVVPLNLGEKISSFTPARPVTSFEPFTMTLFRHIAAGLNMPYELLLKDFSQTNYSSARAALLEAWRFFKGRRKWLCDYWAQPVFELWLEEQVGLGAIEAPDFYELRPYYCRAKWIGDGRGWIDPVKEAEAAEKRMQLGITTLEDECAEQGLDWEEQLQQRSREEKRAKALNVRLPWMSGADTVTERANVAGVDDTGTTDTTNKDTTNEDTTNKDTTNQDTTNALVKLVSRSMDAQAASVTAMHEACGNMATGLAALGAREINLEIAPGAIHVEPRIAVGPLDIHHPPPQPKTIVTERREDGTILAREIPHA
jgi:lambda family phage portal protein